MYSIFLYFKKNHLQIVIEFSRKLHSFIFQSFKQYLFFIYLQISNKNLWFFLGASAIVSLPFPITLLSYHSCFQIIKSKYSLFNFYSISYCYIHYFKCSCPSRRKICYFHYLMLPATGNFH